MKEILVGFILTGLVIGFSSLFFSRLVITLDDSTPYKLYWKSGSSFGKGDYVLVRAKGLAVSKGEFMTKRVLCVGGERVKRAGVDGREFYCCDENGSCVFLHRAKDKTPSGKRLEVYRICEAIPCEVRLSEDEVYLGTSHPDGYDSRYLGPFKKDEIIVKLTPLF